MRWGIVSSPTSNRVAITKTQLQNADRIERLLDSYRRPLLGRVKQAWRRPNLRVRRMPDAHGSKPELAPRMPPCFPMLGDLRW